MYVLFLTFSAYGHSQYMFIHVFVIILI